MLIPMAYENVSAQKLIQSSKSFISSVSLPVIDRLKRLSFTLCGWVPYSVGKTLRRVTSRMICGYVGTSVDIGSGVEFSYAKGIHLEDGVMLERDVCIKCNGKKSKIKLNRGSKIDRGVDIKTHRGGVIQIGANTYIGPYTCLSGDSIKIGKDCLIASHSGLYASNHVFADPSQPIKKQGHTYEGIVIEDDCWLGSGVRVLDGVTIHHGSVIGAGAVVTKDIPPYSVAVGVPAKAIAQRHQIDNSRLNELVSYATLALTQDL
jgi:acetyltransferase-like isoleucine patch superfamily enzyme